MAFIVVHRSLGKNERVDVSPLAKAPKACQYLWQKMQENMALIKQLQSISNPDVNHPLLHALRDTVQTVIQLEIQPQLRHVSSHTTEIYLQWLFNQLRVPLNLTRQWQEEDAMTEDSA